MAATSNLSAGEFDRQVQLQLNTPVRDATTGALADSWADLGSLRWARVRESVGREPTGVAGEDVDDYGRPVQIWLRWFSGFDKALTRVVYDGRTLRIAASAEVGRREYLQLACVDWNHD